MLRDLIKVVKNYCYGLFVVGLCLTGNNMDYNGLIQKFHFFNMPYICVVLKKMEFSYSLTYNPLLIKCFLLLFLYYYFCQFILGAPLQVFCMCFVCV